MKIKSIFVLGWAFLCFALPATSDNITYYSDFATFDAATDTVIMEGFESWLPNITLSSFMSNGNTYTAVGTTWNVTTDKMYFRNTGRSTIEEGYIQQANLDGIMLWTPKPVGKRPVDESVVENVSHGAKVEVLEEHEETATANPPGNSIIMSADDCFFEGMVDCCGHTVTATDVATWISLGMPECWCDPCHCRGDSNGDCTINAVDVLALRAAWPGLGGMYDPCVDTDYDGGINAIDVLTMRAAWPGFGGPGCAGCPTCP